MPKHIGEPSLEQLLDDFQRRLTALENGTIIQVGKYRIQDTGTNLVATNTTTGAVTIIAT